MRATERRRARQAQRDAQSGAGPTAPHEQPALFPGATSRFALFAEALMVGVLVGILSVPALTAPAAMAAGVRHLRRYVAAEESSWSAAWQDFRSAVPGGLVVALGGVFFVALTAMTLLLGLLEEGGMRIAVIGLSAAGLLIVATSLLLVARLWTPEQGWWRALTSLRPAVESDASGALWVALAVVLVGVLTWQLPLLAFPAMGVALLAVVAVEARTRRAT